LCVLCGIARFDTGSILLVCLVYVFIDYSNLDAANKDIGDVDVENRRIYAFLLNENLIYKHCPTLLACSIEY